MEKERKKSKLLTIELEGEFNPQMFKPAWFAKRELIGAKEAESAEVAFDLPSILSFSIVDTLALEVTATSFTVVALSEIFHKGLLELITRSLGGLKDTHLSNHDLELPCIFP